MSLDLDLPNAADLAVGAASHPPAFADAAACKEWIEQLPLSNAAPAQTRLLAEVEALGRADWPVTELFTALEALRAPIGFVQGEAWKKFAHRPLPLADELNGFTTTVRLWRALSQAYQRCLASILEDDRSLKAQSAVVTQRALDALARELIDYDLANMVAPRTRMRLLHTLVGVAEKLGVAAETVKDPWLTETGDTHAVAAYSRALLSQLGSPNELPLKQVLLILRWLERWSKKITLRKLAPTDLSKPPLWVDLKSERGAFRPEAGKSVGTDVRYLDVGELADSLKKRVLLLKRGETPEKLGLGSDCVQPACGQLVINLYHRWIAPHNEATVARGQARRSATGRAHVATGLEQAHYYASGAPFRPPVELKELSAQQREEIATFGRLSTKDADDYSHMHGYVLEQWHLEDESLTGMRVLRAKDSPGRRIGQGQFVAIRPGDSKHYLLAAVRWMRMNEEGAVVAGLKSVVGIPEPVAARPVGVNAAGEKWSQAFLLPMSDALKAPQSLVIPAGWGRFGHVVELNNGARTWHVKTGDVLERFTDVERVAYT